MGSYSIELVPYSDEWVRRFESESAAIIQALGSIHLDIEHIGSTSIEGTVAKPIIDIAIKVESLSRISDIIPALTALSYEYLEEFGLPGRHFFTKGDPKLFHLHVVDNSTDHWERWIKFRNVLRNNPDVRRKYQALKKDLAGRYRFEREKYTAAKSEFINDIVDGTD